VRLPCCAGRWESCGVSDVALMQACAGVVFRDVARTTSLQLALTPWDDRPEGIGAVIHDAAVDPTQPVWEAVGYLNAGDCLALHPPHRHRTSDLWELPSLEAETTTDVAGVTQAVVVMLLWQRGLDATWPPCPEHPGRHPLRASQEPGPWRVDPHSPGAVTATVSVWRCPMGRTAIIIGQL